MSDAQSQRNVPKRQIARLIGSSSFPMWVLSQDAQLVFANEAFEVLFQQLGPEPLGLRCALDAQESTHERTVLARWLALPMNGSTDQVRCVRDRLPSSSDSEQSAILRWIIPLDDSAEPCYLCILKPDSGDAQSIFEGNFHERIEVPSLAIWESHANLDGVWFLQGQSFRSQTLREQLQLAIHADHSLRLIGQPGNYLIAIAGLIFKERRSRRGQAISKSPPFTIDCSLMDKDLLKSTFEWIDDTRRKGGATEVILHRLELLPHELQEALARTCRDQNWSFITTTGFDSQGHESSGGDIWDWLLASSDVQRIEIAPLSERTEEIESLLFAWMRRSPGTRWSSSFLDALLAYAWPGDIDELDRALEEALKAGAQGVLEESHLPISLRTYPSHIERPGTEPPIDLDQVLERLERMLIERALASYPKNNTAAAKSLGISRARLLRRMQQWGLGDQRSTVKEQDEVIFEELDH